MTQLSMRQVALLAINAGFPDHEIVTAVAVAFAESGGRTGAIGDVALEDATWGPSVGLWQIRSLKADYGTGRLRDQQANLDPAVNARHASQLWHYTDTWHPWSTFNSGAYRQFEAAAQAAVAGLQHGVTLGRYLRLATPMIYGQDVADCQQIVGATPDGWYGPITAAHVRSWQSVHGLAVDGIVGPLTAASFGWTWSGPGAH